VNRKILIISIFFLLAVAFGAGMKLFSGEDAWICQDGQWVRHGNPSAAMPTSGCGDDNQQQTQVDVQQAQVRQQDQAKPAEGDGISVTMPQADQVIHGPFAIEGKAKGTWFFEGVFSVKLLDANGKVMAQGQAKADGDWMTPDFVPFSATLDFKNPATATGTLVFQNDNPSGLPANQKEFKLPVKFTE
jgi:hypothetical protein